MLHPEDGGGKHLRNIGQFVSEYTVPRPINSNSEYMEPDMRTVVGKNNFIAINFLFFFFQTATLLFV
jgi:hypothetical protein